MSVLTAIIIGAAGAAVGGILVGYFTVKVSQRQPYIVSWTPTYVCIRCDRAPVSTSPARCSKCELAVSEILLEAALRGEVLQDPLTELRRKLNKPTG